MALVLDTSAVIGWVERNDPTIRAAVLSAGEKPAVSIVTIGELHAGVARASLAGDVAAVSFRERTLSTARGLEIVPVSDDVATTFGDLRARLPLSFSANDLWIVATAIAQQATLATHDERLAASDAFTTAGVAPPPIVFSKRLPP